MKTRDFVLSANQRRIMSRLVDIICVPKSQSEIIAESVLDTIEQSMQFFPRFVRVGLVALLFVFEWGALFTNFGRFSRLSSEKQKAYFQRWWLSKTGPFHQLASGLKSLLAFAYYDQPQVQKLLQYFPKDWIAKVTERRLALHSDAIHTAEAVVLAPDPLVLNIRDDRPKQSPGFIVGRDQLAGPRNLQLSADVIIVGSGAGGGVMAAELAEAGFDVIVFEEGGHYRTEQFTGRASEMVSKLYRAGGAMRTIGTPAVDWSEGCAVGGSTVVNGGISWRTPEHVLERWYDVDRIDFIRPEEMERFFRRVEARVSVRSQDPGTVGRDNEILRLGARKLGWRVVENPRNQVHCSGSNMCGLGCPTGAKQGVHLTYIPRAVSFGARVYSNVRVEKLLTNGTVIEGVVAQVVGVNGESINRICAHSLITVVCGGAIQTPTLLMRSGIHSSSGQIGRNLYLHPNVKVQAIFDDPVKGWQGVHQAYQVREFEKQGAFFAAVNLPPSLLSIAIPYYGRDLARCMEQYNQIVNGGVLLDDSVSGRVRVSPGGQPFAFYNCTPDDGKRAVRMTAQLAKLFLAAGAVRVISPFRDIPDLFSVDDAKRLEETNIRLDHMEFFSVHLMGTARMGSDYRRYVCDSYGKMYGTEGLWVSDASLFPSPLGVNPMITIMALSTRNAERIIELHRPRREL